MSKFEPNKRHLRELLIYIFNLKKSAAEAHRLLVEAYNEAALSERTCREWFQKFKNGDFNVEDKDRSGRPKIYEDAELTELLEEDSSQTQKKLALTLEVTQQAVSRRLKSLGMIYKQGTSNNGAAGPWQSEMLPPMHVAPAAAGGQQRRPGNQDALHQHPQSFVQELGAARNRGGVRQRRPGRGAGRLRRRHVDGAELQHAAVQRADGPHVRRAADPPRRGALRQEQNDRPDIFPEIPEAIRLYAGETE